MSSEIDMMLSEGTIEQGPGNKGFVMIRVWCCPHQHIIASMYICAY